MKHLPLYPQPPLLEVEQVSPNFQRSCTACSLHAGVNAPCMGAEVIDGDPDLTLLVLLPDPTGDDDRARRPFMSASGRYIRGLLRGWKGRVVLDYAVRCAPGSRKVGPSVVPACRPFTAGVVHEIASSGTLVGVLAFGSEAVASIVGRSYPPQSCAGGYVWTHGSAEQPAFTTHILPHPAQSLRSVFHRRELETWVIWALTALAQGGAAVRSAYPPPPWDALYHVVESPKDALAAVASCSQGATFDFETNGRPHDPDRVLLGLSLTPFGWDTAYVVGQDLLQDPAILGILRGWFTSNVPKCGYYGKFDVGRVLGHFGCNVACYDYDPGLLRKMVDPGVLGRLEYAQPLVGMGGGKDEVEKYLLAGSKELGKASKDLLIIGPPSIPYSLSYDHFRLAVTACIIQGLESKDDRGAYTYAFIPQPERDRYNAMDTISSERLRRLYVKRAQDEYDGAQWKHWVEVVTPLHRAMVAIEKNGILVNRSAVAEMQSAMQTIIDDLTAKYPGVSPNSANDLVELLLVKHKLKLGKRDVTPGGQPSFTKETLSNMHHQVADDIVAWRKAIKFKGQYADGLLGFVQADGRIHCNYNIDGAESGRPSANDPNMLNIPSRGPTASACRAAFSAPPGWLFVEADYSQVELRVAAMMSGDPLMIQMFRDGVDFHGATSVMIAPLLGVDLNDPVAMDALRGQAKIVNFALLYGDPDEGLAHKLGCDVRTAAKLRAAILGKFTRLAKWIESCATNAKRTGICRTVWNGEPRRMRKLYEAADPTAKAHMTAVRSSWNTPIQGSATEYTNASLGAIQAWLDENPSIPARLVLTVYDSIMLEVREDWAEDVGAYVKEIMESWPSQGVPIVAELKIGPDWGHLKKAA